MDIPNRDIATAEASGLVLARLRRVFVDATSPKNPTPQAIVPIFGIRWYVRVVRRITFGRLWGILWSLRNSKIDQGGYGKVGQLWLEACEADAESPADWAVRGVILERNIRTFQPRRRRPARYVGGCLRLAHQAEL